MSEENEIKDILDQLDEVSKERLGAYIKKAHEKSGDIENRQGYRDGASSNTSGSVKKANRILKNKRVGISRAVDKLTKEDLEFSESIVTSILDQLDEVSKKTLGSYIKKASDNMAHHKQMVNDLWQAREIINKSGVRSKNIVSNSPDAARERNDRNDADNYVNNVRYAHANKADQRRRGIDKAVKKLTKEDLEISESIVTSILEEKPVDVRDFVFESLQSRANLVLETVAENIAESILGYSEELDLDSFIESLDEDEVSAILEEIEELTFEGITEEELAEISKERVSAYAVKALGDRHKQNQAFNKAQTKRFNMSRNLRRIKDVGPDADYHETPADHADRVDRLTRNIKKANSDIKTAERKGNNRNKGLHNAGKRLAKEDLEIEDILNQLDEVSRSALSAYIDKAKVQHSSGSKDRSGGIELALKKKWGNKKFGIPEPKVKAKD